jgi:hypothetical protein
LPGAKAGLTARVERAIGVPGLNGKRAVAKIESNFENVINASIPANVSALLQGNIDRARTNYDGLVSKFQSYADVSNMIMTRQQALGRQWNARMLENTAANVDAAFEAAHKLAKMKTVKDAAEIHTEFLQAQTQRVLEQTQEAVSLAMKASMEAFETWSAMMATGFGKAA